MGCDISTEVAVEPHGSQHRRRRTLRLHRSGSRRRSQSNSTRTLRPAADRKKSAQLLLNTANTAARSNAAPRRLAHDPEEASDRVMPEITKSPEAQHEDTASEAVKAIQEALSAARYRGGAAGNCSPHSVTSNPLRADFLSLLCEDEQQREGDHIVVETSLMTDAPSASAAGETATSEDASQVSVRGRDTTPTPDRQTIPKTVSSADTRRLCRATAPLEELRRRSDDVTESSRWDTPESSMAMSRFFIPSPTESLAAHDLTSSKSTGVP